MTISKDQIQSWAALGESETQEFKRTTGERREATRTLCAMLNHRGGRVIFGIESDGRVQGQDVSDHTLEDVAQTLQEIDPPVFPTMERVPVDGGRECLVVSVSTGKSRPYSYRGQAYYRVGNTSQEMSRDEYNRMLMERLHHEHRWENEVADGWTLADLDTTEIVRTIEEAVRQGRVEDPRGSRDPLDILRGFKLMQDGHLLRAAVVLFGREERLTRDYPQSLIRLAKFRGLDRTEFIDNRRFHGNIFDLLSHVGRFVLDNVPVAGKIIPQAIERVDKPLYPPLALREALVNAVCHRDYSIFGGSISVAIYDDRLEITSPGSLHFGLTAKALFSPHESLPWNPLIANVLYRRGMIEAWGRGTTKMAELTKEAGLPPPEIENNEGTVTVRFRTSQYQPVSRVGMDVSERQREILAILDESPAGLSLKEVHSRMNMSVTERQLRDELAALRVMGLAQPIGHGRGARWKRLQNK